MHYVTTDVTKRAEIEKLVSEAVKIFGRVDVMINNAGVARNQDFLSITEDDFDAVLMSISKGRSSAFRRQPSR